MQHRLARPHFAHVGYALAMTLELRVHAQDAHRGAAAILARKEKEERPRRRQRRECGEDKTVFPVLREGS